MDSNVFVMASCNFFNARRKSRLPFPHLRSDSILSVYLCRLFFYISVHPAAAWSENFFCHCVILQRLLCLPSLYGLRLGFCVAVLLNPPQVWWGRSQSSIWRLWSIIQCLRDWFVDGLWNTLLLHATLHICRGKSPGLKRQRVMEQGFISLSALNGLEARYFIHLYFSAD